MNPREEIMETKTKNLREVEDVIAKAIRKVNGRKENDLCKYLPMTSIRLELSKRTNVSPSLRSILKASGFWRFHSSCWVHLVQVKPAKDPLSY